MGDPECQTILPKLKTDLLDLFLSCCSGNLHNLKIDFEDKKTFALFCAQKAILIKSKGMRN